MLRGASFDTDLEEEIGEAMAEEVLAYGGNLSAGVCINLPYNPGWGRSQETYGEDPYLSGRMGMAAVRGLQGPEDAEYDKLHACAKHFAVHSGPEWNRHSFNAENIAPRDLWETYLPAFKELVQKAGVKEVMCAYNVLKAIPAAAATVC